MHRGAPVVIYSLSGVLVFFRRYQLSRQETTRTETGFHAATLNVMQWTDLHTERQHYLLIID